MYSLIHELRPYSTLCTRRYNQPPGPNTWPKLLFGSHETNVFALVKSVLRNFECDWAAFRGTRGRILMTNSIIASLYG
jgi:hypothetical protein